AGAVAAVTVFPAVVGGPEWLALASSSAPLSTAESASPAAGGSAAAPSLGALGAASFAAASLPASAPAWLPPSEPPSLPFFTAEVTAPTGSGKPADSGSFTLGLPTSSVG